MYELTPAWEAYYRELEPARRREMLEELCRSQPDDGADDYRRQLLTARHTDPKQPGREVDNALFLCVTFLQMFEGSRLFRGVARRQVRKAFQGVGFESPEALGEAGRSALYWEMRNTAARYFSTCSDPGYNRGMFGLVPSTEEGRRARACQDAWRMSRGLARKLDLQEEMRLWNRAVLDAYLAYEPQARALLDALAARVKDDLSDL